MGIKEKLSDGIYFLFFILRISPGYIRETPTCDIRVLLLRDPWKKEVPKRLWRSG